MRRVLSQSVILKGVNTLWLTFCVSFTSVVWAQTDLNYEKALSAFQEKNFKESMIHLKNALHNSPESLPSKILMGELLVELGHIETAEVEFDEAIRQGANISLFAKSWGTMLLKRKAFEKVIDFNQFSGFSKSQLLDWHRIRTTACMRIKNYICAKESLLKIGNTSNDKTEQLNGLASIELNFKNYAQATLYLKQSMALNDANATTWQLKGLLARSQNQLNLALTHLQKAFDLDPDNTYILRHLADVYLASNNKKAAKQTINNILNAAPDDPYAILVNSWLQQNTALEGLAESKFKDLAAKIKNMPNEYVIVDQALLFLRALVAFRQQEYNQASRDFVKLRNLDDKDISPVILLAKSYIALNKEKDAIELLESKQEELTTLPHVLSMLGDLYINNGKNFKALSLLQNLQMSYPKNVDVKLLETKLMIARGKTENGLNLLDGMSKEYPNNEVVLLVHSVLNLQTQRFEQAEKSISQLLALKPNDPNTLNIKGAVLIKLDKIDQAQSYFKQALKLQPNLLSAKINLASTFYLKQQWPLSLEILQEILRTEPRTIPALLLVGKIQLEQQKLDAASSNFRKILIENRTHIAALEGLTSIHITKNDLKNALIPLSKLSKIESENPKYIIQKAQIHISLQDIESAQREITKLSRRAQNDAALLIAVSKLQLAAGYLDNAITSLSKAQTLQPKSIEVGLQLAELLLNNEKTAAASKQLKVLNKNFTNTADISFLQGRLAEQHGNINSANTFYLNTLNRDDQYELALAKMYSLIAKGQPDKSFKDKIDEIVKVYPERYFPRNLLAQYHYYRAEYAQAAFHYEKLLNHKEQSNKAAMLNRLANVYMTTDLTKSTTYIKQAYELDNQNAQILTTYGWLLTQQNQPQQGLVLLRKAWVRSQQNPALHYYIAVSLDKLGLKREAKSELETLFQKTETFTESDKAKALYEQL